MKSNKNPRGGLLTKEARLALWVACTFLACSMTAFVGLLTDFGEFVQALVLLHFSSGLLLTGCLFIYLYLHFVRTLGMRRPMLVLSGVVGALLLAALASSGLEIGLNGRQQKRQWVFILHYYAGFATFAIVLAHLALHRTTLPNNRRGKESAAFITLVGLSRASLRLALGVVAVLALIIAAERYTREEAIPNPLLKNYQYDYGSHPFRPSHTETANNGFISEVDIANSDSCASCHSDIALQWASSAHKRAASDPAYVTNINLLERSKGITATRYCEGCHAPIALLTGELTPGGKHGGIEGTSANKEGISCTSCHRITSVIHTKGVASYEFTPATQYLFEGRLNPLLNSVNRFLIGAKPAQHIKEMGPSLLSDPKVCATCHSQFMDIEMNGWGWVKMQDDYSAWLESPYAAQHEQRFGNTERKSCQDCHMPKVEADDPSADTDGKVRDHRFLGANTMLAVVNGDEAQLAATEKFLQSNKMRISIQKPYRGNPAQNLQALDEALRATQIKPWYFYKDEVAVVDVIVSNVGVGHDFPGGTLDINEAWVHIRVTDAEGHPVFESGFLDNEQFVDPDAYFYRSQPVDRRGQLVWKHDLFNQVGEVYRNSVRAGESDIVSYKFEVPSWSKSPLMISSSLFYRKLNKRYAQWALGEKYTDMPVTEMARAFLSVNVREKEEAKSNQ